METKLMGIWKMETWATWVWVAGERIGWSNEEWRHGWDEQRCEWWVQIFISSTLRIISSASVAKNNTTCLILNASEILRSTISHTVPEMRSIPAWLSSLQCSARSNTTNLALSNPALFQTRLQLIVWDNTHKASCWDRAASSVTWKLATLSTIVRTQLISTPEKWVNLFSSIKISLIRLQNPNLHGWIS